MTTDYAGDVFAWLLNISSCVLIIYVNKVLVNPSGYAFFFWYGGFLGSAFGISDLLPQYHSEPLKRLTRLMVIAATSLGALQYGVTSATMWSIWCCSRNNGGKALPLKENVMFSFLTAAGIASSNLSLMLNPISVFQVTKLAHIPFVCSLEAFLGRKTVSTPLVLSMVTVMCGVAIVTVTDFQAKAVSAAGLFFAGILIVAGGTQQVYCRTLQQTYDLSPPQLLTYTSPTVAVMMMLTGPTVDWAVTKSWVFDYTWSINMAALVGLSCATALGVNLSQFMCLGRFSATTFQVMGHAKTLLVLLLGWLAFEEPVTARKAVGLSVAVVGMTSYTYFTAQPTQPTTKATTDASTKAMELPTCHRPTAQPRLNAS